MIYGGPVPLNIAKRGINLSERLVLFTCRNWQTAKLQLL